MYLPDINIWLALAFQSHIHHRAASAWIATAVPQSCCFCRLTQMGFLRLATNPQAFSADAATLDEAWRLYDAFLGDPRMVYADEPAGVEFEWRSYTAGFAFSPKVWNDAYLAAFARVAGWQLVTFDKAFHQYTGLNPMILS